VPLKNEKCCICRDPIKADVNSIFLKEFEKNDKFIKINSTDCDLSKENLEPNQVVSDAINSGADSIVFHPFVDKINRAIEIAKVSAKIKKKSLELFSVPTLYTYETLQRGGSAVNGMILAVAWHPELDRNNPFTKKAQNLWNGPVSWRTAMSYDTTMLIAQALSKGENREEVQKYLKSKFFYKGATGKVEFLDTGNRKPINIRFVKIQKSSKYESGYEFVLLP
jgi:branched-chain amino acid transport system substrate-binding protein